MLVAIILAACETSAIVEASGNISVEETKSETFTYDGKTMEIKVNEIQDSRCPENANCVRAGEAIVRFDFEIGGDKTKGLELCLNCESPFEIKQKLENKGYTLTLEAVNPYPNTNTTGGTRTAVFSLQ